MPDPENPQAGGPDNSGQGSTGVVNADGSFVEGWENNYAEADRPTLSRFKKFDDFVTSHMSLRRMSDKDPDTLIELPGEDSSDEVKAAFHKARGVPEKAEDYKYERGKDLSENIDIDDAKVAAFTQIAKKHNFTQEQFNGAVNEYLALVDKDITNFDVTQGERDEQEREKGVAVLKSVLGNALEERTLRAEAVMRKYGDKTVKDVKGNEINILEQLYEELPGVKNSPWLRLLLDNIAEDMNEDRIKGLTSVKTKTPTEIIGKIAELRAHPGYMDEKHPQHQQIQDQITELYKKKSA